MEARCVKVDKEAASVAAWALPSELMDDILSRLPAKTLCRFKCVCKAWLHTLSDLSFMQLHYARSIQKPPLLVACDCNSIVYGDISNVTVPLCTFNLDAQLLHRLNAIIPRGFIDILKHPSCFSLFCLQTTTTYVICNPSTGEVVPLPHPSQMDINAGFNGGFGCYPASSNHYQHRHVVVHVLTNRTGIITGCEELTFGIGDDLSKCSWRMLNTPPPPAPTRIEPNLGGGTLVDGVFYWMIDPSKQQEANQHEQILCLDLKEERFTTIPLPPDLDFEDDSDSDSDVRITKLKGQLYLMCPFVDLTSNVQMWKLTMEKTNKKVAKWSKEYSICVPHAFTYFYPMHILNHEDLLVSTESRYGPESIHSYDKQTNTLNNLVNVNTIVNNSENSSYWGVRLHTDNIFSLRSNSILPRLP